MSKICPVCGKSFEPKSNNQRYCCPECQAENSIKLREAWKERTDYNGKQRQRMREVREREKAVKNANNAQQNAERAAEHRARMAEARTERMADLEHRASEGEVFAQMQLAVINGDGALYWELRKLYEELERERIHAMFR